MHPAKLSKHLLAGLLLAAAAVHADPQEAPSAMNADALITTAEQSGFKKTGRYEEAERLCHAYAQAWPQQARCFEFGRTPEGRAMVALAVNRNGVLTAEDAAKKDLPVLLLQGGIHPGESDGKDAGFIALREMLNKQAAPDALDKAVVLFVPVFNVDGHERFGRWNRPNQVGPEEMGWRVTAQNLNLNRDYTKADAPEMQAMLQLLDAWDPLVYVDLHVTDGANFQHDISITVAPLNEGDAALHPAAQALQQGTIDRLARQGSLPLPFYPDFVRQDDPSSGFAADAYPPRFSTGYWALRNRFAMLVETHSWKDYATRVHITRNTIVALGELIAANGQDWLRQARDADARATALGGTAVALNYAPGEHVRMIDFQGYAYTREPSAISGGLVTRYNTSIPQVWHVPFKDTVAPTLTVDAPKAGYIVPAAFAEDIGRRLTWHGVRFQRIGHALKQAPLQTFRAGKTSFAAAPFEGRTQLELEGDWKAEARDVPAGSLFVPIAQPEARLVMALLEPRASDSFAAWGLFNACFEQKEYMEPYVAEQVGEQMLASDPAVADEFRDRLAKDPAFAASPQQRLDFFYRRSPSWDERYNLYPVYRTDQSPA